MAKISAYFRLNKACIFKAKLILISLMLMSGFGVGAREQISSFCLFLCSYQMIVLA